MGRRGDEEKREKTKMSAKLGDRHKGGRRRKSVKIRDPKKVEER